MKTTLAVVTTTIAIALLFMFGMLIEEQPMAYAQQAPPAGAPPGAPVPEEGRPDQAMSISGASQDAKNLAITLAVQQLWNLTAKDPSITFTEDGKLSIFQMTPTKDGAWKITSANVEHPFTPENGWKIDNGQLIAPNGSAVFP